MKMKRSWFTSLAVVLVACLCLFGAFHTEAHAASVDDLTFKLNEGSIIAVIWST